jgi:hypothetical protein
LNLLAEYGCRALYRARLCVPNKENRMASNTRTAQPEPTHLLIEIAPGHILDLTAAMEFDDKPEAEELLVILPAPAYVPVKYTTADPDGDGSGPYVLVLEGANRQLALRYIRWRLAQADAFLSSLPE